MNIYESIAAIIAEIGAVGKDSRNTTQGWNFRGIDAAMNATHPLFAKYHVFAVPEVLDNTREERINSKGNCLIYSIMKIRYTFYAEDGSNVSAIVTGEGMDTGDKASNKAMAVAMKYALFQVLCIPTEEMIDPDYESHEVAPTCEKCGKPIMALPNAAVADILAQAEKFYRRPAHVCAACLKDDVARLKAAKEARRKAEEEEARRKADELEKEAARCREYGMAQCDGCDEFWSMDQLHETEHGRYCPACFEKEVER